MHFKIEIIVRKLILMRIGFTLHKVRSSVVSDESWVPGGLGQAYTIFFNKQPITLFSVDG